MSTKPVNSSMSGLNLRGAVDLGALAARRPAPGQAGAPAARATGQGGGPAGETPAAPGGPTVRSLVMDVTDESFMADVVELSMVVPVVVDLWAEWCQPCKQLSPVLERLVTEQDGALVLAKVDTDANPQISESFRVQSIPAVFAVIKGQVLPLFQGAQPEAQIRPLIGELLRAAAGYGVDGRVTVDGSGVAEEYEPELPPLHQAAYDAIERDDLDAAVVAYVAALKENPGDDQARLGLAQVRLLQRTRGADLNAARAAAAAAPTDVQAQILAADLDLLGGHVDDAFGRLIDTVRVTAGDDRNTVRTHLVELFDVVGAGDPLVAKARMKLSSALF